MKWKIEKKEERDKEKRDSKESWVTNKLKISSCMLFLTYLFYFNKIKLLKFLRTSKNCV